jgi:molybdopterin-guanine dinucleotide biosynthesis protein B
MSKAAKLPPVVSVIGRSDSGKNLVLEGFITELKRRGYTVATVKHNVHGFDIDQPGKDSWRHAQAGADKVLISSPTKWALISKRDSELSIEEIQQLIQGVDIILTEGYSQGSAPKIEILAEDTKKPLFYGQKLLAVVSTLEVEFGIPCFKPADFSGIVDFM